MGLFSFLRKSLRSAIRKHMESKDTGELLKICEENGETPLCVAATAGYLDVVKTLLDAGADVNAKDNRGETVLAYAREADLEIIRLLEKAAANQVKE